MGRLLERCGGCPRPPEEVRPEVRAVCDYLEAHCDRRITLEQLSTLAGLSKYHLLRCFTRQKGITPYRYLETVRVNRARALLEQGAARWTRPCGRALPIRATSTTFQDPDRTHPQPVPGRVCGGTGEP